MVVRNATSDRRLEINGRQTDIFIAAVPRGVVVTAGILIRRTLPAMARVCLQKRIGLRALDQRSDDRAGCRRKPFGFQEEPAGWISDRSALAYEGRNGVGLDRWRRSSVGMEPGDPKSGWPRSVLELGNDGGRSGLVGVAQVDGRSDIGIVSSIDRRARSFQKRVGLLPSGPNSRHKSLRRARERSDRSPF